MIAANLLNVYDVSDYQPTIVPTLPAALASAPTAAVAVVASDVNCKDCLPRQQNQTSIEVATTRPVGRVVSGKDLVAGSAQVVPVSGLQR